MTNFVTLKGKTRKGKTRIGTSGPVWAIDEVRTAMSQGDPIGTTRLLIRSLDGKDWRWIRKTDDPDFEIVAPEGPVCGMELN